MPWVGDGEASAEFTNEAGYHVGPARTEVSQGALSFRYVNHPQKPQFPFSTVNGRPVVYAPLARGISARPAVFSFTFETSVTPTAVVTGDDAQDRDPPAITCSKNPEPVGTSVSLVATDGGTGVKTIYYSTDGANFQAYSEPVTFDSPGIHVVYAFAEDNAANRSGLSSRKIVVMQRLPRKLGHRLARAAASRKRP